MAKGIDVKSQILMIPEAGDVERLTKILGRPLHSYRAFASEIAPAV